MDCLNNKRDRNGFSFDKLFRNRKLMCRFKGKKVIKYASVRIF